MAKYRMGTYQEGCICGVINIYINHISYKDKVIITIILQKCVLHLYHRDILHPRIDRMEATIRQHLYCPSIREAIQKEVKMVTLANVQNDQIKMW